MVGGGSKGGREGGKDSGREKRGREKFSGELCKF